MNRRKINNRINSRSSSGIVLLVTLVLLVVLSIIGYTLTGRVVSQCHRNRYLIDYQAARYACDSATKYAIAELSEMSIADLISRPNEPDFSDLFKLSDDQYQELLREAAIAQSLERKQYLPSH